VPTITSQLDIRHKTDRAVRAQQLMDDPLLIEICDEMKREALQDFITSHRWWHSNRRRRLAAERLREIEQFRNHLDRIARYKPSRPIAMA